VTYTELTVINIINAITPNGDNVNDVIFMQTLPIRKTCPLQYMTDTEIMFLQAHALTITHGAERSAIIKLFTGTYWYVITWKEPALKDAVIKYTGWILLKN
jgi:hypothetical protein